MITPDSIRSKMQLQPNMRQAYMRVVMAGKKVMYSPQMQGQVVELLKGPGSMGHKLGQGVVSLMGILLEQSQNTLPPQLIIPAATELVAEAADFLRKAGAKVSDNDIAEGIADMIATVMQRAGISPEQLPELMRQQGGGAPQQQQQAPRA
jgi:hypothetical protein